MNLKTKEIECLIKEIIQEYELLVQNIDKSAMEDETRSYGGVIRTEKGRLVENITQKMLHAAWLSLGESLDRITFNLHPKYDIPIREKYVENIKDVNLKKKIQEHIAEYKVSHGTDIHVYIDRKFVLAVECKTYCENAMMKRILFDAFLLKTQFPDLKFALVQMESQLGGDYSKLLDRPSGSPQTHTLMSYMPNIHLEIITLLEGNRKVNEPIHKEEFYKSLENTAVENAITTLAKLLQSFR